MSRTPEPLGEAYERNELPGIERNELRGLSEMNSPGYVARLTWGSGGLVKMASEGKDCGSARRKFRGKLNAII
jgi:hypothetical protein